MDKLNSKKNPLSKELYFLNPVVIEDLKRFGNKNDGGYVLSERAVLLTEAMISMGINDDWSLEAEVLQLKPEIKLDAYDHTISSMKFRRELKNEMYKLLFFRSSPVRVWTKVKKYYGYVTFFKKSVTHYQNRIFDRINYEYDTTINLCFEKIHADKNVFIKMDIEGAEYRALPQLLAFSPRIHMLAIEFHETAPHRKKFEEIIKALQEYFEIVHIHGNNDGGVAEDGLPETLEITMLNKMLLKYPLTYRNVLPIPNLDAPNAAELADLPLIFK